MLINDFSILLWKFNLFVEFRLEVFDLRLQTFLFIQFILSTYDLAEISVTFFEKHFMNVGLIFIRVTYIVGVTLFFQWCSLRIDFLYNSKSFRSILGRYSFDKLILLIIFRLECFIVHWREIWHSRMSNDIL